MAQRILVTGSEGSLMSEVIPRLLTAGHEVVGVDLTEKWSTTDYEYVNADLREPDSLGVFGNNFDAVIQSAANIYGVGGFNDYCAEILMWDTTIQANCLNAALEYDIPHFVSLSSSMVYENCIQNINYPVTEDMPDYAPTPATEYGLSKLVGERMVIAAAKQFDITYTIWRPFNIITPNEEAQEEIGVSHVFADYIKYIVDENISTLPIIGDGEQIRCFTWIGDVADAISDYSLLGITKNEIFNIGNPEPISMKGLARLIKEVAEGFGVRPTSGPLKFQTIKNYPNDVRIRIPNIHKALDILGWQPKVGLVDSIKHCLRRYNEPAPSV